MDEDSGETGAFSGMIEAEGSVCWFCPLAKTGQAHGNDLAEQPEQVGCWPSHFILARRHGRQA